MEAEKKFKQVGAAHAILSDPAKRQKYDAGASQSFLLYSLYAACWACGLCRLISCALGLADRLFICLE